MALQDGRTGAVFGSIWTEIEEAEQVGDISLESLLLPEDDARVLDYLQTWTSTCKVRKTTANKTGQLRVENHVQQMGLDEWLSKGVANEEIFENFPG